MNEKKASSGMVRVRSTGNMGPVDAKPERKVLVIYTGGTIGMIRNQDGGKYLLKSFICKNKNKNKYYICSFGTYPEHVNEEN